MLDAFQRLWQGLLEFTSRIVIPDWGELIGLVPVLLVVGVLGPVLSLLAVAWIVYGIAAPRRRLAPEAVVRSAPLIDGRPAYPAGEPYCAGHRLIHPFGADRCAVDGGDLVIGCPKCGLGRPAHVAACGSCGLELRMTTRAIYRPATPPAGGAAAA